MEIAEGTKLAFTVVTSDSVETTHIYDAPQTLEETRELIKGIRACPINPHSKPRSEP